MRKVVYSHLVSLDGFIAADESYEGPNWASSSRLRLLETKQFDCGVVLLHYSLQST